MIAVSKVVCILSCGFVLGVSLSDQPTWAGDGMEVSQRIGGQAGRPYEHVKHESESVKAGERIGGQAGRPYEQEKHE